MLLLPRSSRTEKHHGQAVTLKSGWIVGATVADGLTSILGPIVDPGEWMRVPSGIHLLTSEDLRRIVAYACERADAEALVARLNGARRK
jgi:hypothetical protein